MNRKFAWGVFAALFLVLVTATWLSAAPTIGAVSISPTVISVNTPTTIAVTAVITDPLLLPQSVNLIRISSASSAVLGVLHDDGRSGDAIAGDHVFTALVQLNESYPTPVTLQVSAAFTGLLRRVTSPPVTVAVQGLILPTVLNSTPYIVQGTVTSLNSYSSGLFIVTDLGLSVARTIKGNALPTSIVVSTLGGTVGTETQPPPYVTQFTVGQQVVLFLDGPGTDNKYSISSGLLGIFRVQQNPAGQVVAVIDPGYSRMEMDSALDPTFAALLSQSSQSMLSLDALIAAVSVTP